MGRFKYSFIFITIFTSIHANAQLSVGMDAGIAINRLEYHDPNSGGSLSSSVGYIANLAFRYKISRSLLLEADLGQLEKNYISNNDQGIYLKAQNTYLQLPIKVGYSMKITNGFSWIITLGGYGSYWTRSTNEGLIPNVYDVYEGVNRDFGEQIKLEKIKSVHKFDSQIDNRPEFGWLCGTEINYVLTRHIKLSLKGQLFKALTGQEKLYYENQVRKYNQTLTFTSGVIYEF